MNWTGLKKRCHSFTRDERRNLIEKKNEQISVKKQCSLLGIARSSLYYRPEGISEEDRETMNLIDEIYTAHPFYGNRRIKAELNKTHDVAVGRSKVRTLMEHMGICALYPKKNLSRPNKQHAIYPYLLKNITPKKPNEIWSADITYVKLLEGFAYLIAIIDWFSRYVIAWKVSNSLEIDFCLECLEEALKKGKPDIFNSDQGSHFTSPRFTGILEKSDIQISMDGRGRCLDNIFVERLWRSVKQENIYLSSYRNVLETRLGLQEYFRFYNTERRHQSLEYATPESIHYA